MSSNSSTDSMTTWSVNSLERQNWQCPGSSKSSQVCSERRDSRVCSGHSSRNEVRRAFCKKPNKSIYLYVFRCYSFSSQAHLASSSGSFRPFKAFDQRHSALAFSLSAIWISFWTSLHLGAPLEGMSEKPPHEEAGNFQRSLTAAAPRSPSATPSTRVTDN